MKYGKAKRDRPYAEKKAMAAYRLEHPVCEACGREQSQHTHHIITKRAGGPGEAWNFLALCAVCHSTIHDAGWKSSCDRFPRIAGKIVSARVMDGRSLK